MRHSDRLPAVGSSAAAGARFACSSRWERPLWDNAQVLPILALAAVPAACAYAAVEPPVSEDASAGTVMDLRLEAPAIDVPLPPRDAEKFGSDANMTTIDANCGAVTHTATMLPADILIVLDRSLSMLSDKNDLPCLGGCGAKSKWYQVTTALNTVLNSTDAMVNWGLLYFGAETTVCGTTLSPSVPVAMMNASAISQAFVGQPSPTGQLGTPTRSAMINAVTYLTSMTDSNPKYLLLATDGAPNCAPGGGLLVDDAVGSEQAVADALAVGYPTFVVGIGNTGDTAVLNAMAMKGGKPVLGAPGGNSFYQVNDTADLEKALGDIVGTVTTCVFDIGRPPNAQTNVDEIVVFGDGHQIQHNVTDGWDFSQSDKTQVTLYGSSCDAVTSGAIKSVTVTFGCIVS